MKFSNSAINGRFFTDLPGELQQALSSQASTKTYRDGAAIHRRGDASPGLCIVRSGSVRLSNVGRDGREVVLISVQPGESFGEFTLFADLPRQYDFIARGETTIDTVSAKSFETLTDTLPELSRYVIRHLAQRLHQALELLDDERRLPLTVRLSKLLLRMSMRGQDNTVNATQQEIADELAVSRVALSQALRQLNHDGLIEKGYRRIRIRNLAELQKRVSDQAQLSPANVSGK